LFFKRKKKLIVDLGELKDEAESLSSFLRSNLKVDVATSGNKLLIDSEELTSQELKKSVTRFVYHRNLNNIYWVATESDVVRINRFKAAKKPEKRRKEATPPSTVRHGW